MRLCRTSGHTIRIFSPLRKRKIARVTIRPALLIVVALACLPGPLALAQDSDRPRAFPELRGTWLLEETSGNGLRQAVNRVGQQVVYDGLGFPVARRLVIATTPTEISLTKDGGLPERYRFDGVESQTKDPRTGGLLDGRYRFTLVAGSLALTSSLPSASTTQIVTDLYDLKEWDVLTVQRQLSYLAPAGHLRTLSGIRNLPQTFAYRRQPLPGR